MFLWLERGWRGCCRGVEAGWSMRRSRGVCVVRRTLGVGGCCRSVLCESKRVYGAAAASKRESQRVAASRGQTRGGLVSSLTTLISTAPLHPLRSSVNKLKVLLQCWLPLRPTPARWRPLLDALRDLLFAMLNDIPSLFNSFGRLLIGLSGSEGPTRHAGKKSG